MADISKADKVKINIILAEQADAQDLIRMAEAFPTKAERREFVINTLKRQAADAQAGLIEELNILETNGLVEEIRPLWLVNSVSCYANEEAVSAISQRKDILAVYQCEEFQCIEDVSVMSSERGDRREIAENIVKVNADQVWALGYTGENVLVALIDTGARLDHADLQGRLWDGGAEYPNHGYDFYQHDNDPSDTHGHGTHVAGTIVGTGVSGTQTGVAPGATLMVLKVFHGEDNLTEVTMWVEAMQFAVEHGADVMNMSLGQPLPDSSVQLMLRQACDNTLAAGVVAAVCAGNSRQIQMLAPVPYNIWSPGDCPPPHLHEDQMVNAGGTSCVICVGAVNNNDVLGDFSSEGPATWSGVAPYNDYPYSSGSSTNIGLIRPDVCAPGVNVKSLDFNTTNGYCLKSGTSMATPCVAGTIALMLSKDHELTPEQIDEILERTAVPLSAHKSNDFGSGRIDALAAVNAVGDDGVEEIDNEEVVIYPNPVDDIVMIETHGRASLQNVIIYDVNGRKVLSTSESQIDISDIPSGIYMMKIELSDGIFYKKIIKE
ncbi:MAG: S8 family peptidase [Bacteroidales bacterium]|nr:S8 family peptidase [Bacteroidales bacterium]